MPPFGRAHDLLSSRHPDTSPPAGGADPDDGHVVTWSAALGAFHAADPAGGVTDHGLLTGLVPDDDHTQYALLAGRSGGQTFVGGSGSGEHVTLQATAHATRGYVRAQDDLQLLSNIIRDAAGTNRLQLSASSPHLDLTGDVQISGSVGVKGTTPTAGFFLDVSPVAVLSDPAVIAGRFSPTVTISAVGSPYFSALEGVATVDFSGDPTGAGVQGLSFATNIKNYSTHTTVIREALGMGIFQFLWLLGGALTITNAGAIKVLAPINLGVTVGTYKGLYLAGAALAGTTAAYGAHIEDITGPATIRLLEVGPATPYLRVVGGAAPAANQTNVYFLEQATLRHLQTKDGAAIGGGDRVCVAV